MNNADVGVISYRVGHRYTDGQDLGTCHIKCPLMQLDLSFIFPDLAINEASTTSALWTIYPIVQWRTHVFSCEKKQPQNQNPKKKAHPSHAAQTTSKQHINH